MKGEIMLEAMRDRLTGNRRFLTGYMYGYADGLASAAATSEQRHAAALALAWRSGHYAGANGGRAARCPYPEPEPVTLRLAEPPPQSDDRGPA